MQFKIILFLVAITILLACGDKKYGLNPVSGKTDTFSVVQTIINHLGNSTREQIISLQFSLQCLDKEDSSNRFLFTITSFRLDPTPPYLLQVVNFDSLKKALASGSYEVTVDKTGRVKTIKGEDEMLDHMFNTFNSRYIARSYTADYFGANAVKDLLNRFFSVVPHKVIRAGDNWVKDITFVTKAPVRYSNLFSYERENGDSVFIKIKSLISADQGDLSNVYMKGNQLGEVVISMSTGMPLFYNTKATMVTTTVAGGQTKEELFEIKRLN